MRSIYDLGLCGLAVAAALWAGATLAATGLRPPCDTSPDPPYPEVGAPVNVQVWSRTHSGGGWRPPACTGWAGEELQMVVAIAGRFRSSPDALLQRLGAVSEFTRIRYWSVTRHGWRDLIDEAYAVEGPDGERRRPDLAASELQMDRDLYFYQDDKGPASGAVYRLRVRERSPDRLVLETENVGPVRLLLLPLFDPGALRALYFFVREDGDVWDYYSLTATGVGANRLVEGHPKSHINRAVAIYRYAAGLPTDGAAPAAP